MPQVLAVAAAAISFYFAFRWVRRESDRVEASLRRAERRIRKASPAGTPLTFDAAAGVYRPID